MACVAFTFVQAASAEIAVKSGDKIAFLGDSITAGGWGNPVGYVRLVMAGLEANGVKAEAVPAGISGHKSDNMLARLERDVIAATRKAGSRAAHSVTPCPLSKFAMRFPLIAAPSRSSSAKCLTANPTPAHPT